MSSEQYDSLKGYKYISNIFLEFPRLGPQWHSEFLIQGFIATLNTLYTLLIAGRREIPHLADLCRFSMCQWYIMTLCTF